MQGSGVGISAATDGSSPQQGADKYRVESPAAKNTLVRGHIETLAIVDIPRQLGRARVPLACGR